MPENFSDFDNVVKALARLQDIFLGETQFHTVTNRTNEVNSKASSFISGSLPQCCQTLTF